MKRNIHAKLLSLLERSNSQRVLVIEGARQVGKSYLVNSVLEGLHTPYLKSL